MPWLKREVVDLREHLREAASSVAPEFEVVGRWWEVRSLVEPWRGCTVHARYITTSVCLFVA